MLLEHAAHRLGEQDALVGEVVVERRGGGTVRARQRDHEVDRVADQVAEEQFGANRGRR